MGRKILVIDDEEDVVKYLSSLLKDNGFEPIVAYDGKEGMKLAKEKLPDIVDFATETKSLFKV